jgi:hypothetical protein
MGSDRNALCECQSGKKFKHCCAIAKPRSSHRLAAVVLILFVAAAAWGVYGVTKRVFSADNSADGAALPSRPPGPPPPGKEWSYEHGHWHDTQSAVLPKPAGPAPPGKVWSVEHGHWHDLDGGEPATVQAPPVPDSDVNYSE